MALTANSSVLASDLNALINTLNNFNHYHRYYDYAQAAGNLQSGTSGEWKSTSRHYSSNVGNVKANDAVSTAHPKAMANVLASLLSHTHTYRDDYGNACNCNCNCNCTRGII